MNFDHFLRKFPQHIQSRVNTLSSVPQNPMWHPEGDVLKHTKIVFARLNAWTNGDVTMLCTAVLHDIGKDVTTAPHPKTGAWCAHEHDKESAKVVLSIAVPLVRIGADPNMVYQVVKNHMRIKSIDEMRASKQARLRANIAYGNLLLFMKADKMFETDWQEWV